MLIKEEGGFPGGPMVKNLPDTAGVRSLVGEWRFHISQRQLSLGITTTEPVRSGVSLPQLERSLYATTKIPRAAANTRHSQRKKEKGGKEKLPPQSISPILDVVVQSLQSCPTLVTSWTVARQAPLSMGFPRQEYWSGLPFPSPGDLPDPGVKPGSPALQVDSLLLYSLSHKGCWDHSPKSNGDKLLNE